MHSTFKEEDVKILTKNISNLVTPLSYNERQNLILKGKLTCEVIPLSKKPSQNDFDDFEKCLNMTSRYTAILIKKVAEKIYDKKGVNVVLVSMARGGITIGILIKKYLELKYKIKLPHYAICIIRDNNIGIDIDQNALKYITKRHDAANIQFIDGWTGKGAMANLIKKSVIKNYPDIDTELAVVSDPAYITNIYGTHDDILLANAYLISCTSGLLSKGFYSNEIIKENDFFGTYFYEDLKPFDKTYNFINSVSSHFNSILDFKDENIIKYENINNQGIKEIINISKHFNIDKSFIKPGINEAIRSFDKKLPDLIIVNDLNNTDLEHILKLANDNNITIKTFPLKYYKICALFLNKHVDIT